MMSCRATGRGAIDVLLGEVERVAGAGGATGLRVPVRVNDRNVPLRLALLAAGFHAGPPDTAAGDGRPVVFAREPLDSPARFPQGIRVVRQ